MSRYDDKGVWHPPVEPGRLEYEAELCTRNPAPHAEPSLVGTPSRTLQIGPATTALLQQMDRQLQTAQLVQSIFDKPAAVIRGCYDVVNEVPKVRAELTPDGRGLPAGTVLWPHQTPRAAKALPPVPKQGVLLTTVIDGKRVELRGWTTEMMQPWIDAVQALFKESR